MRKVLKVIKIFFILWILYTVVSVVIVPMFHKTSAAEKLAAMQPAASRQSSPERVKSIDNNRDALLWRLRLIEAAKERIVLTTFDFRDDSSGQDIMSALWHAAERGVQVQILVDGMNGFLWLGKSRNFKSLAAHENVEVKFYNPVNLLLPGRLNYRMHDKYLIADDFAYLLGGRNTDDLFLGTYAKSYNEDRDILVYETVPGEGRSFISLQEYFNRIWNLSCCKSIDGHLSVEKELEEHYRKVREAYPEAFAQTKWDEETIMAESVELYTNPINPENKQPLLWDRIVQEIRGKSHILIQTPYIICSKKMYQDLADICSGSRRTELIINAVESGTNPFGCTDYLNQKKKIQKTGSFIYEYLGEQALHTKTILADDSLCIVGSCNVDMRSIYLDTEMMLFIESPELNASIRAQAEGYKKKSRQIRPDGESVQGEEYRPVLQSTGKKMIYGILRAVTLPIRHLL